VEFSEYESRTAENYGYTYLIYLNIRRGFFPIYAFD
jgi:hypothetical protein